MSYEIERQLIEDLFKTGMGPGSAIQFGNTPFNPPKEGYTRISILGGTSGLLGVGNIQQRRYPGVIDVTVFVPTDSGNKLTREIADKVDAALAHKDVRQGSTRIVTYGIQFTPIGKLGDWHQSNITVNFHRDEQV